MDADAKNIEDAENAKYVILSLLRELDVLHHENLEDKTYAQQMEQLRTDLRHYHEKEVVHKVKELYIPYLQSLLEKKHGI